MGSEHLHPARPEYLRRGTPVCDFDGDHAGVVVGCTGVGAAVCWASSGRVPYAVADLRLDLRDVTARAHAAMPYILVGADGSLWPLQALREEVYPDEWPFDGSIPPEDAHLDVLCRMRANDETVTWQEAKAALLWAEGVLHG